MQHVTPAAAWRGVAVPAAMSLGRRGVLVPSAWRGVAVPAAASLGYRRELLVPPAAAALLGVLAHEATVER